MTIVEQKTAAKALFNRWKAAKKTFLKCPNELVRRDTEEIQYNVPELFIDEGEE